MPLQELGQRGDSATLVGKVPSSAVVEPFIARSRSFRAREAANFRIRDYSIRALNVLMALLLIVFFLPLMLLISLLVWLTSPGPVLYAQTRVGLDTRKRARRRGPVSGTDRRSRNQGGRIFKIYKFRTMRVDGDDSRQVWASEDDPRVTRTGRFLRAHRLDELPQLFNVLKGDMNLVGPRPEQPEIFQELRKAISVYPERQRVRPGITGWAQVNHRYDASGTT